MTNSSHNTMTTLVVGASGATGKLLVEQLLNSGNRVKIIVRPSSQIPEHWNNHDHLKIIRGNITEFSTDKMAEYITGCHSIACCLGHTPTLKGIYGKPRRLVTDAVQLLCGAIQKNTPNPPLKFVLMNTTGYKNKGLKEPLSFGESIVFALLRLLVPPHADNEKAADFLRIKTGLDDPYIEWVTVRPDTLTNENNVTPYTLHPSHTTSPIFKPGKTSRINVAHFMSQLLLDNQLWETWKGRTPVIYNDLSTV